MADQIPDANPEEAKKAAQLANLAKARAVRAENLAKASLTEQAPAPETVTPEVLPETPPVEPVAPAPVPAPVALPPVAFVPEVQPRQMRVERQGARSEPYTRRFPQIRCGICEFCGVIDANTPSQYQYKLCAHYRGMQAACSYCPSTKDADEVVYHAAMNVAESPTNPGQLIMWCDSYECTKAHIERFQKSRT